MAWLSRPDLLQATAYLTTKAHHPKEVIIDHSANNLLQGHNHSWDLNHLQESSTDVEIIATGDRLKNI